MTYAHDDHVAEMEFDLEYAELEFGIDDHPAELEFGIDDAERCPRATPALPQRDDTCLHARYVRDHRLVGWTCLDCGAFVEDRDVNACS